MRPLAEDSARSGKVCRMHQLSERGLAVVHEFDCKLRRIAGERQQRAGSIRDES
jgi:hypothetical protein